MQVEFDTVAQVFREVETGEVITNLQVRSVENMTVRNDVRSLSDPTGIGGFTVSRPAESEATMTVRMRPLISVTRSPSTCQPDERSNRRSRVDRLIAALIEMMPRDRYYNDALFHAEVSRAAEALRSAAQMTPPLRPVPPQPIPAPFSVPQVTTLTEPEIRNGIDRILRDIREVNDSLVGYPEASARQVLTSMTALGVRIDGVPLSVTGTSLGSLVTTVLGRLREIFGRDMVDRVIENGGSRLSGVTLPRDRDGDITIYVPLPIHHIDMTITVPETEDPVRSVTADFPTELEITDDQFQAIMGSADEVKPLPPEIIHAAPVPDIATVPDDRGAEPAQQRMLGGRPVTVVGGGFGETERRFREALARRQTVDESRPSAEERLAQAPIRALQEQEDRRALIGLPPAGVN